MKEFKYVESPEVKKRKEKYAKAQLRKAVKSADFTTVKPKKSK